VAHFDLRFNDMSNQYTPPQPWNDDGSNRLRIYRNIQTNESIGTPGGNIRRGPSGLVVDQQPLYYGAGTVECGDLDTGSFYKIGDIVRVPEDKDYDGAGSGSVKQGMYLCVSPVPSKFESQRLAGIRYVPLSPEPSVLAHEVTDLTTQGRYWQAFGVP